MKTKVQMGLGILLMVLCLILAGVGNCMNLMGPVLVLSLLGVIAGALLGILLFAAADQREKLGAFQVPAVCMIVLAMLFLFLFFSHGVRSAAGPFLFSLLLVAGFLYLGLKAGRSLADPKLLEMAGVFHMPEKNRLSYLIFPAAGPRGAAFASAGVLVSFLCTLLHERGTSALFLFGLVLLAFGEAALTFAVLSLCFEKEETR